MSGFGRQQVRQMGVMQPLNEWVFDVGYGNGGERSPYNLSIVQLLGRTATQLFYYAVS